MSEESTGGEDGKRHSALAAGRADTGDYSVVAVLRPLTVSNWICRNQAPPMAEPFLQY
jgi:hypothetical protein